MPAANINICTQHLLTLTDNTLTGTFTHWPLSSSITTPHSLATPIDLTHWAKPRTLKAASQLHTHWPHPGPFSTTTHSLATPIDPHSLATPKTLSGSITTPHSLATPRTLSTTLHSLATPIDPHPLATPRTLSGSITTSHSLTTPIAS